MLIMNNIATNFERASTCGEKGELVSQTQNNKGKAEAKSAATMPAKDEGESQSFSALLTEEVQATCLPVTDEDADTAITDTQEEAQTTEGEEVDSASDAKNIADLLFLNQLLSSRLADISAKQAGVEGGKGDVNALEALMSEEGEGNMIPLKKDGVAEKGRGFPRADRRDADKIGLQNISQRLGQKTAPKMAEGSPQSTPANFDSKGNPQSTPVNFDKIAIGDKIALKTAATSTSSPISPINGVEILQSKKTGALTLLHLKLDPVHLGPVEARIRTSREGLHIELRAERQSAARSLAQDQLLLTQILDKSGFGRDGQIHVHVAEQGGQIMQNMQGNGQQSQDIRQNNASLSQFLAGNGANSAQDEGRRAASEREKREEDLLQTTKPNISPNISLERSHLAHRDSHRLFV